MTSWASRVLSGHDAAIEVPATQRAEGDPGPTAGGRLVGGARVGGAVLVVGDDVEGWPAAGVDVEERLGSAGAVLEVTAVGR
jgi:hypothetical protein